MQYFVDSSRSIFEHLWIMSAMTQDLIAARQDNSEERILHVLHALPEETKHRKIFRLIMVHNENMKTFKKSWNEVRTFEIVCPFQRSICCQRKQTQGWQPYHYKWPKKGCYPLRTPSVKVVLLRNKRVRDKRRILQVWSVVTVKRRHSLLGIGLRRLRYLFPLKLLNYMDAPMHLLQVLFHNGL